MAIAPDEPQLAGFIAAKDDGGGGDNWSYKSCRAPAKSSPPTPKAHILLTFKMVQYFITQVSLVGGNEFLLELLRPYECIPPF